MSFPTLLFGDSIARIGNHIKQFFATAAIDPEQFAEALQGNTSLEIIYFDILKIPDEAVATEKCKKMLKKVQELPNLSKISFTAIPGHTIPLFQQFLENSTASEVSLSIKIYNELQNMNMVYGL